MDSNSSQADAHDPSSSEAVNSNANVIASSSNDSNSNAPTAKEESNGTATTAAAPSNGEVHGEEGDMTSSNDVSSSTSSTDAGVNGNNVVADDELIKEIKRIVPETDFSTTTINDIRKVLEKTFDANLADKMSLIRAEVKEALSKITVENEDEEEEEVEEEGEKEDNKAYSTRQKRTRAPSSKPKEKANKKDKEEGGSEKKKRKSVFSREYLLATELAVFMNKERASRHEVVKALWDYVKEKQLQDPRNKKKWILDEALQKVFKGKKTVDSFKMNKDLTKMLMKPEEVS